MTACVVRTLECKENTKEKYCTVLYTELYFKSNKYFMPKAFYIKNIMYFIIFWWNIELHLNQCNIHFINIFVCLSTLIPSALRSSGRIFSNYVVCSSLAIFIYQMTNDAIN